MNPHFCVCVSVLKGSGGWGGGRGDREGISVWCHPSAILGGGGDKNDCLMPSQSHFGG